MLSGVWYQAKRNTPPELLVPIQCAVERREHEVEGGMGGSASKRAISNSVVLWKVPQVTQEASLNVHLIYAKWWHTEKRSLVRPTLWG